MLSPKITRFSAPIPVGAWLEAFLQFDFTNHQKIFKNSTQIKIKFFNRKKVRLNNSHREVDGN